MEELEMNLGENIEDFGSLRKEETELMWCWFYNHDGSWTVAKVVHDADSDDFCVAGEPITFCSHPYGAEQLVTTHNHAIYQALDR